jgi:hypothetical protein
LIFDFDFDFVRCRALTWPTVAERGLRPRAVAGRDGISLGGGHVFLLLRCEGIKLVIFRRDDVR